jgi:hypothetical protein
VLRLLLDLLRLTLRMLLYVILAAAVALLLWYVLFAIGLTFGEGTPECTDSDTCSAWGDFLYHDWPGGVVCLLLGAVIAWLVLRVWDSQRSAGRQ